MKRRFVDLSIYLENDVISDPPPFGPKIQYHKHENTAGQIASFFPCRQATNRPAPRTRASSSTRGRCSARA